MPSAEFSWSSNHWGQIQSSLNCFIQDFLIARGTSANSMTWLTSDWKPSNESFLQGFLSKSGSRLTNAKAVLWFADSCTFFSCEFLRPEREQASFMPDLRPPYPLWLCPVSDERVSVLNLLNKCLPIELGDGSPRLSLDTLSKVIPGWLSGGILVISGVGNSVDSVP